MGLFDFTKQITQPLNDAKANLSNTTSKFTGALSETKGKVGDVKGGAQGAARQIFDTVKQGQAGYEDFQVLVGLKDPTEEFLKKKASVQAETYPPLDPTGDVYQLEHLPYNADTQISIRSFLTYIKDKGLSKTNRFRIEFVPPPIILADWIVEKHSLARKVTEQGDLSSTLLGYSIESFAFPGISFDTVSTNYGGYHTPIATGYNIDEVSLVLRCFGDMDEKAFFDRWANSIYNFKRGSPRFFDDYAADIYLYQTDETNNDVYCVLLKGTFPKAAGSLDLNTAAQGEYHRLTLQMAVENVIPIEIADRVKQPLTYGEYKAAAKPAPKPAPPLGKIDQFVKDIKDSKYGGKAAKYLGF
jgi:hypothetical protein